MVEYPTGHSNTGSVTQLHHKIQIKYPQVSQDTITVTDNRNTMCMLLNMKYNNYSEL